MGRDPRSRLRDLKVFTRIHHFPISFKFKRSESTNQLKVRLEFIPTSVIEKLPEQASHSKKFQLLRKECFVQKI
jgi:hypothetical protein